MRKNVKWGLALASFFLVLCTMHGAFAQTAERPPDPDPMKVMQQACDYLKSLKQFSFRSEVYDDQVYHGGKKLQYGIEMETYVRRPDRLRVNAEGDLVSKQFFFNGKSITLYDKPAKVYATMDVPHDIEGALEKAHKDFGLRVALTDLASPTLWDHISRNVEHALYVGLHKVRGVECHHLSFNKENVQWQVWIEAGDKPLVRKVVFTQKKLEGSPQWTAFLADWNLSPTLDDGLFQFTAPSGVKKARFVQSGQPSKQGKKKGGKS